MNITLNINLDITDETAFRQAAREKALEDGLDEKDADTYLEDGGMSLSQCAIMLLDPGVSPPGSSILDSYAD